MSTPTSPHPTATAYHRVQVLGRSMFYREAGSPTAPAIVLLHGFPSSSHMFRDLIPLLADSFHVIAPDYIGFGYSDAPDAKDFEYSFDQLAAHVQGLLDQIGISDAIHYMQDYGGPVGMRLATAHPERVKGLMIQNANANMEGLTPAVAAVFMPLWEQGHETGARGMLLAEPTRMQYTAGARDPQGLNPDAWTHDQALLDRPGSADRHMALCSRATRTTCPCTRPGTPTTGGTNPVADAPKPHDVAQAIAKLVAAPSGQRPTRTIVGAPFGADAVNASTAMAQAAVVRGLGLGHLDVAAAT